ncbi:hypothetical protein [Capnocytophaga cynodegmi]|uniref:Uncharacterized protein n=2 Tax=Capnocytophaga cynodegmi TaxID=28189 RepID=A0A0B7HMV9_9FLAO|nr:hypothetical protein [Capnocytophaga cynodegmi]CEN39197.1 conserved hypothetical protein [Capnocytophaga cynodegmi]
MAQSNNNIVTHGLSGKVGDILVFSQRNGKTIVSKAPKRKAEFSDKQKEHHQKFQKAVIYAKGALQNPTTKQMYDEAAAKKEGLNSYNIAVADLMNAPKIEQIDLSAYTGQVGDLIKIKAYDDFAVKAVTVEIQNSEGTLVEKGNAIDNGLEWIYTTTVNNPNLSGDKIIVRATDNPDNLTEKEVQL